MTSRRSARATSIFIPPATQHGILNDGSETLVYVSAASPPVSMAELYGAELSPGGDGYDDD